MHQLYKVTGERGTFTHDGKTYGKGQLVLLDTRVARPAVKVGALEPAAQEEITLDPLYEPQADPVDKLPADFPQRSAFVKAGYVSVGDIKAQTDETLLAITRVGRRTVDLVRAYGLHNAPNTD